jgi:hypothetical protein
MDKQHRCKLTLLFSLKRLLLKLSKNDVVRVKIRTLLNPTKLVLTHGSLFL